MTAEPQLILQLRRMGDLILTFPLILDLKRRRPQNPVWVVAEPQFFEPLRQFSPEAVFFPPYALKGMETLNFHSVINLSGEPMAALFAEKAKAQIKIGRLGQPGRLHMLGFWQLYRAALIRNNRHNLFHWADLFRLDFGYPLGRYERVRAKTPESGRVGLFLGASELSKRPDADFWAALARRLAKDGRRPVLMGGPGEKALGEEVGRRAGLQSFCGKTDLRQLASLLEKVDLLVTPDTGPMHLADWLGTPTLNLSLGNVSAWETGPFSTGRHVCQASMTCAGCWQCQRGRQHCRAAFAPAMVSKLVENILLKQPIGHLPGLEVYKTAQTGKGLHELSPVCPPSFQARHSLGRFWRAAFLHFAGLETDAPLLEEAKSLASQFPRLAENLAGTNASLLRQFVDARKHGRTLPDDLWQQQPAYSAFLAGHCQMWLQNANHSRQAWEEVFERLIILRETLSSL